MFESMFYIYVFQITLNKLSSTSQNFLDFPQKFYFHLKRSEKIWILWKYPKCEWINIYTPIFLPSAVIAWSSWKRIRWKILSEAKCLLRSLGILHINMSPLTQHQGYDRHEATSHLEYKTTMGLEFTKNIRYWDG